MTRIKIEGYLGKLIGNDWKLKVRNFRELFSALDTNSEGSFRMSMLKCHQRFAIFCNGSVVDSSSFLDQNIQDKEVLIIPVLSGSGVVAAAALTAGTAIAPTLAYKVVAFVTNSIIGAAISFGLTFLMSKLLAADDPQQANTSSFVFGTAQNVASQGAVVPIGYGRMRIGSNVISSSLSSIDRDKFDDLNENNLFSSLTRSSNPSIKQSNAGSFTTIQ